MMQALAKCLHVWAEEFGRNSFFPSQLTEKRNVACGRAKLVTTFDCLFNEFLQYEAFVKSVLGDTATVRCSLQSEWVALVRRFRVCRNEGIPFRCDFDDAVSTRVHAFLRRHYACSRAAAQISELLGQEETARVMRARSLRDGKEPRPASCPGPRNPTYAHPDDAPTYPDEFWAGDARPTPIKRPAAPTASFERHVPPEVSPFSAWTGRHCRRPPNTRPDIARLRARWNAFDATRKILQAESTPCARTGVQRECPLHATPSSGSPLEALACTSSGSPLEALACTPSSRQSSRLGCTSVHQLEQSPSPAHANRCKTFLRPGQDSFPRLTAGAILRGGAHDYPAQEAPAYEASIRQPPARLPTFSSEDAPHEEALDEEALDEEEMMSKIKQITTRMHTRLQNLKISLAKSSSAEKNLLLAS